MRKYSDDNTNIYLAGEPLIRGYGYYYLPVIVAIFFISDGIMILALYIFFRNRSTWWAPLVTGTLATAWGLGFIGLEGFEFDPVMLVIRFVLTARDMGHAIQWQGRYCDELEARAYDKHGAIAATTTLMLAPGLLSILADIAGIVLVNYLMLDASVDRVISVAPDIIEPFNRMFHYAEPRYRTILATTDEAYGLFSLFVMGTAPGEADVWLSMDNNDACMRVLLRNHTYETLSRLQRRLGEFVKERRASDPAFRRLDVLYLGGIAGLYAAANDVLYRIDFLNITFVLAVVFLFCAVTYRSIVAGLLFVTSCIAANSAAFIYMRAMDSGITIYTIPVISLGIGLGVDYGIYTISRVVDECGRGRDLEDAITTALRGTGAAVLATFVVIVGGLAPWMFSPVLFHNQMAVLLIILMFTNLVLGLLILPAYVAWARPRFIFAGASEEPRPGDRMAVD